MLCVRPPACLSAVQHPSHTPRTPQGATSTCIQCLRRMVVVDQIPVHRNQQLILHSLMCHRGDCLSGLHNLIHLEDEPKRRLLGIIDLVSACCLGYNPSIQALAQGLLPLSLMLKLLAEQETPLPLTDQVTLLQCLQEVWWARHLKPTMDQESEDTLQWWNATESWWYSWWAVVGRMEKQVCRCWSVCEC